MIPSTPVVRNQSNIIDEPSKNRRNSRQSSTTESSSSTHSPAIIAMEPMTKSVQQQTPKSPLSKGLTLNNNTLKTNQQSQKQHSALATFRGDILSKSQSQQQQQAVIIEHATEDPSLTSNTIDTPTSPLVHQQSPKRNKTPTTPRSENPILQLQQQQSDSNIQQQKLKQQQQQDPIDSASFHAIPIHQVTFDSHQNFDADLSTLGGYTRGQSTNDEFLWNLHSLELHGRTRECKQIEAIWHHIKKTGQSQIIILRGSSGQGKTRLAQTLRQPPKHLPHEEEPRWYIQGKFEQPTTQANQQQQQQQDFNSYDDSDPRSTSSSQENNNASLPFAAISSAFTELIELIIHHQHQQSPSVSFSLRQRIQSNLQNALSSGERAILQQLIPNLSQLLPPKDNHQQQQQVVVWSQAFVRLKAICRLFLHTIISVLQQPIIFSLEDCQWMDPETREIIFSLVTGQQGQQQQTTMAPSPRPTRNNSFSNNNKNDISELTSAPLDHILFLWTFRTKENDETLQQETVHFGPDANLDWFWKRGRHIFQTQSNPSSPSLMARSASSNDSSSRQQIIMIPRTVLSVRPVSLQTVCDVLVQLLHVMPTTTSTNNDDDADLSSFFMLLRQEQQEAIRELAIVVHNKTRGNMFFVLQYLESLYLDRLLVYLPEQQMFSWDVDEIRMATNVSDNVATLLTKKIKQRLTPSLRRLLQTAAFLGFEFSMNLLEQILMGIPPAASLLLNTGTPTQPMATTATLTMIRRDLTIAVREGLIENAMRQHFKFSHDKIQRCVYELIPSLEERQQEHLRIGLFLQQFVLPDEPHLLFMTTDQCNHGLSHVRDDQVLSLARLNLKATQSAMEKAAYTPARQYIHKCILLIQRHCKKQSQVMILQENLVETLIWRQDYPFALEVFSTAARVECATGHYDKCQEIVDSILHNVDLHGDESNAAVDKQEAYCTQLESLGLQLRHMEAIKVGQTMLAQLDVHVPSRATEFHIAFDLIRIKMALRGNRKFQLTNTQDDNMMAPKHFCKMRILFILSEYALLANMEDEAGNFLLRMVILTIKHGLSPLTAFCLSGYAMIVASIGWKQEAFLYAQMCQDLLQKWPDANRECRAFCNLILFCYVHPWQNKLQPLEVKKAYESGLEVGNVNAAYLSAHCYVGLCLHAGVPLGTIDLICDTVCKEMQEFRQMAMYYMTLPYWQTVLNFMEFSPLDDPTRLSSDLMDEDDILLDSDVGEQLEIVLQERVLLLAVFFRNHPHLARAKMKRLKELEKGGDAPTIHFEYPTIQFCKAITYLDSMRRKRQCSRRFFMDGRRFKSILRWIEQAVKEGAQSCRVLHKFLLAEHAAFRHEISPHNRGASLNAVVDLYNVAIAGAKEEKLLHLRGLANERASRFCIQQEGRLSERGYNFLLQAMEAYNEWNASAKVQRLEEKKRHMVQFRRNGPLTGFYAGTAKAQWHRCSVHQHYGASLVVLSVAVVSLLFLGKSMMGELSLVDSSDLEKKVPPVLCAGKKEDNEKSQEYDYVVSTPEPTPSPTSRPTPEPTPQPTSQPSVSLDYDVNKETDAPHQCAPWIEEPFRRVIFIQLHTFESFQRPQTPHGGENYLAASVDWALSQLGFRVERFRNWAQYQRHYRKLGRKLRLHQRLIYNGDFAAPKDGDFADPRLRCRLRQMDFFNHLVRVATTELALVTSKQILVPYPSDGGTFIGFFIHDLVTNDATINNNGTLSTSSTIMKKERAGLLLGKDPKYFQTDLAQRVVAALHADNFTLYSTCQFCGPDTFHGIPVKQHFALSPREYRDLLQRCAFVIGMGDPVISPSPLIAMSVGTAFLNMVRIPSGNQTINKTNEEVTLSDVMTSTTTTTQHNAIRTLGPPYIYHYKTPKEAVVAANAAHLHPFRPFVPAQYRPEAMIDRVCAMMEDDSPCNDVAHEIKATWEIRSNFTL